MNELEKLIEGLQAVQAVSPRARPWAYQDNIVIGPVDAPDGSATAAKLKAFGWDRADEDQCGDDAWSLYVKG